MNALYGVPDVKEMHHRNIKLVTVPASGGLCSSGTIGCFFLENREKVCQKYCPGVGAKPNVWIRESQMPDYLAARLTRETT